MGTLVEAIENFFIPEPEAEVQSGTTQSDGSTIETQLTQEISNLWSDHVRLSAGRKATSKELRQIRLSLAGRLHEMKSLLSHPGRGGQWRSWLKERGIPRSTADRLAARHAETLGGQIGNCPSGAISPPAKDSVGVKLANRVWPQITKYLTTSKAVVEFLGGIAESSGVPHEWRSRGLMIFNPAPKAADELANSTSAQSELASKPSDAASGNTDEPAAKAAMTNPTSEGQASGDGTSNSAVL